MNESGPCSLEVGQDDPVKHTSDGYLTQVQEKKYG